MPDLQQLAGEIIESVKRLVERSSVALIKRIEALETRQVRDGKDGVDGKDGAPGPQGEKGSPGERGEKGEVGERGEKGEAGQPGPQGEKGEVGAPGDRGEKGDAGEKGADGIAGERGEPGPAGPVGERGAAGLDGKDGAPGARGEKGDKGVDGKNGVDGLAIRPEIGIDTTRSYREGIWASYRGGLVRAMRDTHPLEGLTLEGAGWAVMVDGLAGIEVAQFGERAFDVSILRTSGAKEAAHFSMPVMIHRGVYKDGQEYVKGDVVTWAGSQWHCEVEKTTAKPDDGSGDWKLVVKRGRDGKDGKDK